MLVHDGRGVRVGVLCIVTVAVLVCVGVAVGDGVIVAVGVLEAVAVGVTVYVGNGVAVGKLFAQPGEGARPWCQVAPPSGRRPSEYP